MVDNIARNEYAQQRPHLLLVSNGHRIALVAAWSDAQVVQAHATRDRRICGYRQRVHEYSSIPETKCAKGGGSILVTVLERPSNNTGRMSIVTSRTPLSGPKLCMDPGSCLPAPIKVQLFPSGNV